MTDLTADHGPGTVYLICLSEPFTGRQRAPGRQPQVIRHYIGLAPVTLDKRMAAHRAGNGARMIQVITAAGIGWQLARTWPPAPGLERTLKKRKNARKLCPICAPDDWARRGAPKRSEGEPS